MDDMANGNGLENGCETDLYGFPKITNEVYAIMGILK